MVGYYLAIQYLMGVVGMGVEIVEKRGIVRAVEGKPSSLDQRALNISTYSLLSKTRRPINDEIKYIHFILR